MITGSMLEDQFRVFPETGEILYQHRFGRWFTAGNDTWNGYRVICFCGRKMRAHHIVWVWVHGRWPIGEIDHINGDRSDNRINNLREVTVSQNRTNKKIQSNNKSGFKWVSWHKQNKCWCAEIHAPRGRGLSRKRLHQSMHSTAEKAYEAACSAARKLHGPYFNPG